MGPGDLGSPSRANNRFKKPVQPGLLGDALGVLGGIVDDLKVKGKAAIMRGQLEAMGPLNAIRAFFKKDEKDVGAFSPGAVLDARFANEHFGGGRSREIELLAKIEDHTKKAADAQGGFVAGNA
jgi:hypothetical protein